MLTSSADGDWPAETRQTCWKTSVRIAPLHPGRSTFISVFPPTLIYPPAVACSRLQVLGTSWCEHHSSLMPPSSSPPHYASVIGSPVASSSSLGHDALQHSNASAYTLATIPRPASSSSPRSLSPVSVRSHGSDRSPLLRSDESESSTYGATMPMSPNANISSRKILLNAGIKMAVLFVVSTLVLGGTLWLALPPLEE